MQKKFAFLSLAFALAVSSAAADDEKLTYYIPMDTALEIVPQDKTLHFSEELGVDLTAFPIPWEEQVRNAVINAGGSDTKDFVGGTKYWVPFDPIPGEENYPMQRRLFINAQRGYQRAVIHDMVAFERLQEEYSSKNKEIVDRYKAESEESLNEVLAGLKASQDKIAADKRARQRRRALEAFYENECSEFFPEDVGGCGTLGFSIVNGDSLFKVPPLKASPDGEALKPGDVFVTTPNGRVLARMDANYWVGWFKYDDRDSDVTMFSWAAIPE